VRRKELAQLGQELRPARRGHVIRACYHYYVQASQKSLHFIDALLQYIVAAD
jgi:hypothetical protein